MKQRINQRVIFKVTRRYLRELRIAAAASGKTTSQFIREAISAKMQKVEGA